MECPAKAPPMLTPHWGALHPAKEASGLPRLISSPQKTASVEGQTQRGGAPGPDVPRGAGVHVRAAPAPGAPSRAPQWAFCALVPQKCIHSAAGVKSWPLPRPEGALQALSGVSLRHPGFLQSPARPAPRAPRPVQRADRQQRDCALAAPHSEQCQPHRLPHTL